MTASFREIFIISFLIIIHEIGHTIMAYLLGVEVKEIYIYPLGGISKFNMDLNISINKELLILIMGPIFQFVAYFILFSIMPLKKELISIYHYSILSFNLLPIYPLDGGKLLNLVFNRFIPYKLSLNIINIMSYFIILGIFIFTNKTTNIIIMIILLIFLVIKESKRIKYNYNKFLLERYLNNYSFKDKKIITNSNNFYRDKKHIIKENNKYYLEKEYLEKLYKNS